MRTKSTVLVVEDDEHLREALTLKLRASGYRVITAADGDKALKIALREHPDLMLLDIWLSKLNGYEVVRALRQDPWGRKLPVIILTNDDTPRSNDYMLKNAAPAYYIKSNTSLKDIVSAVFFHLEQE